MNSFLVQADKPWNNHYVYAQGYVKVVICNKYENLNKKKHISLIFNRLFIFVILYRLQYKKDVHTV